MSIEILVPSPGESITEVEISQWLKNSGDRVDKDEALCEIESEKVTLTVYAEESGILEVLVAEGETIAVGSVIAKIEESSEQNIEESNETSKNEKESAPQKSAGESKSEPVQITVPSPGESITEVEISQWLKEDGDFVQKDEEICEIESEKVSLMLYAEVSGQLKIKVPAGESVAVGAVAAEIIPGEGTPVQATKKDVEINTTPAKNSVKEDNKKEETNRIEKPKPTQATKSVVAEGEERSMRREKMSQLRKKLSQRLVTVKNQTAMLTTFNEVDMLAIKNIRAKYKEPFKQAFDVNLGFMSFFTRAVTIALADYPAVNAQIDGEELVYHDYADIGIAVSSPKGLMVPILRNAEKMTFAEIEKGIAALAEKARSGKITMDEMTGGTFTITNGGIFGSMLSTPILNPPQSGILGMHNIVDRAMVINGQMEIRPIMYLALSYDHRVIDGRESVGFLVRVKELLEAPEKMLLGLPAAKK